MLYERSKREGERKKKMKNSHEISILDGDRQMCTIFSPLLAIVCILNLICVLNLYILISMNSITVRFFRSVCYSNVKFHSDDVIFGSYHRIWTIYHIKYIINNIVCKCGLLCLHKNVNSIEYS